MLASDEDGSPLAALKFSLASDIIELVVLSVDGAFLQTLRDAVGSSRRLWHVLSADKVSDLLVAGQVGIVVLDVQALTRPANLFVEQIKRQCPDRVVIVAGSRDGETALARLISAGIVYRFIHKPMSPARAKLFAEAAIKKYEEQRRRAAESPKRDRTFRSSRTWLMAGPIRGILLIAAVIWLMHRGAAEDNGLRPAADVLKPAARESPLLTRAAAALAANRLTEPKGDNALELYLQVLARDPADADARTGVAEVHERLLARAENALLEERLDEAASAIETARNSGVESGRVAFLTAQLAKMHEQIKAAQTQIQQQSRARASPKAEESQPATRMLADSAGAARAEPRESAGAAADAARIEPARSVPVAALPSATPTASPSATPSAATSAASNPGAAGAASPPSADAWSQLLKSVNERLLQDRLIEPENDNAKYYFLIQRQLDPGNSALGSVLQDLGSRLTAKARRALILGQYDAARSWLEETAAIGFTSPEIGSLQQHIDTAAAKQTFMTTLIPASQLKLLKSVQPAYPSKAQASKMEGWVDVEFTIAESGHVKGRCGARIERPGRLR